MTPNEAELACRLHEAVERMVAKSELLAEAMEALCTVTPGERDEELLGHAQAHVRETKAHAARLLEGVPVMGELV